MGTYNKQRGIYEDENMDRAIEAGHIYVDLQLALGCAKDGAQAEEIKAAMAALLSESAYLRQVLDSYGPYRVGDALAFLAGRKCRDRDSEFLRDRREAEQAHREWRDLQSTEINGGILHFSDGFVREVSIA